MKYPKRDKYFRDQMLFVAKETGVPIAQVEEAIESYLKIMAQIIEWDKPVTIHVDYIGDLVFNQKWKDKVAEIALNKK